MIRELRPHLEEHRRGGAVKEAEEGPSLAAALDRRGPGRAQRVDGEHRGDAREEDLRRQGRGERDRQLLEREQQPADRRAKRRGDPDGGARGDEVALVLWVAEPSKPRGRRSQRRRRALRQPSAHEGSHVHHGPLGAHGEAAADGERGRDELCRERRQREGRRHDDAIEASHHLCDPCPGGCRGEQNDWRGGEGRGQGCEPGAVEPGEDEARPGAKGGVAPAASAAAALAPPAVAAAAAAAGEQPGYPAVPRRGEHSDAGLEQGGEDADGDADEAHHQPAVPLAPVFFVNFSSFFFFFFGGGGGGGKMVLSDEGKKKTKEEEEEKRTKKEETTYP